MNKQELVEAVAKELGTSKAGGERAVSAVLCGIATGFNPRTRTLDGTFGVESLVAVTSQTDQQARSIGAYGGHEPYGDLAPRVQMQTITPYTQISIPIYNSTINTTIL